MIEVLTHPIFKIISVRQRQNFLPFRSLMMNAKHIPIQLPMPVKDWIMIRSSILSSQKRFSCAVIVPVLTKFISFVLMLQNSIFLQAYSSVCLLSAPWHSKEGFIYKNFELHSWRLLKREANIKKIIIFDWNFLLYELDKMRALISREKSDLKAITSVFGRVT
jgi:hypothetical protein